MLEIILSLLYISFLLVLMGKLPLFTKQVIPTKYFKLLFLVKICASILLYLIYTKFYPDRPHADIFRYYDDSEIMYRSAFTNPYDFFRMFTGIHGNDKELWTYYDQMRNWFNSEMIFNDSRTMIRINAIFRFISFGCYFPHAIIMCFLSMMGLTGLFSVLSQTMTNKKWCLLIGIFLMPSTLLWTSGMIKEAFLIFSIGMLIYNLNTIIQNNKLTVVQMCSLVFYSYCLLNIKSYILFAILPGIISWFLINYYKKNAFLITSLVHVVYFIVLFNASSIITNHPIAILLKNKQIEFYHVVQVEKAKTVIDLPILDGTNQNLLINCGPALFSTLFRPTIFESNNVLLLLAAAENLIILLLIILAIYFAIRRATWNSYDFFFPSLFFVLIMLTMIGLVTPIMGAMVRYKVPTLPFLVAILISFIKFPSLKKSNNGND